MKGRRFPGYSPLYRTQSAKNWARGFRVAQLDPEGLSVYAQSLVIAAYLVAPFALGQMLSIEPQLTLSVDVTVYPKTALFRACYLFTGRCWVWLVPGDVEGQVKVHFALKDEGDLAVLQGEFANALIDHAVRWQIDCQTQGIRSALISAALTEASNV